MKSSRSIAAITIGIAAVLGVVAASPATVQAISCPFAPVRKYEEHRFSGSSTLANAFKVWFNGDVYIEPIIETLDLADLQVNETQVVYVGDIIYKDENGNFWVKQLSTVKYLGQRHLRSCPECFSSFAAR